MLVGLNIDTSNQGVNFCREYGTQDSLKVKATITNKGKFTAVIVDDMPIVKGMPYFHNFEAMVIIAMGEKCIN